MYCVNSNCTPPTTPINSDNENCPTTQPNYTESGFTPYSYMCFELQTNKVFFENTFNSSTTYWSNTSCVTPRISGLNYTQAVKAMVSQGIRYVVGDNSRLELQSKHKWHLLEAPVVVGVNGVLLSENEREVFKNELISLY
eukprot:Pgem_evm1s6598